jgi:5-methyltetrahydrofolate--homocysteine methyltransferase
MTLTALDFKKILQSRSLVMDGGMGTMIQGYGLDEAAYRGKEFADSPCDLKGNNDLLNLTQPDIIREIIKSYLEAGSDLIQTNTFNSTGVSQADYQLGGDVVYRLNYEGARISSELAREYSKQNSEKPRFVYGVLGPTSKTSSLSPRVSDPGFRDITFVELVENYNQAISGLVDGGADILMVETIFDTLNAKAAIYAINKYFERTGKQLPVMISGTVTDLSGRTLSGQTVEAFYTSISHARNLVSVGLNCALGARQMLPFLQNLSRVSEHYISVYPNAGLPNEFGGYDEGPQEFSGYVEEFLKEGLVNLVGGCCGTTPKHIAALPELLQRYPKRVPVTRAKGLHLSGLEAVVINELSNFVNVGERTNISGSSKFAGLIRKNKFDDAVAIAADQVRNGAQIIDINMDDGMLDGVACMRKYINLISTEPEIARVPFMIDSSKWSIIEAGLQTFQGKCVVNSISLKEGEESFRHYAQEVQNYGAAVVVMAFDEQGQADTYERKTSICQRVYNIWVNELGFNPEDLIFDPNIFAVATGIEEHNNYAVDFIRATEWIKKNLPGARVSGGVSNLSFSFRGNQAVREAMHSVFLYHACKAGMDMGIVHPGQLVIYDGLPPELKELAESVVLNKDSGATERLINYASSNSGKSLAEKSADDQSWRALTVEQRLHYALVNGIADHIEGDLDQAVVLYSSALEIIEGPLMEGMNQVGDLFGAGKMFLPQVVKSARVMKKGVAHLLPLLDAQKSKSDTRQKPRIVMATVKGDVHDIGKNIVGVVLGCNNFEVHDLGVLVPCEKILAKAREINADLIGLSGLITPSLDEMVHVAKEMQRQGFTIPLLIGGATTSRRHTAIKIAPAYEHGVVYVQDASRSVPVAQKLVTPEHAPQFLADTVTEYEQIRNDFRANSTREYVSLAEARKNPFPIDWSEYQAVKPKQLGVQVLKSYPLRELFDFIDWSPFFHSWEMRGRFPDILSSAQFGTEAKKLYVDAQAMLERFEKEGQISANGVFALYPANSLGDDVQVYTDESRESQLTVVHMLRQQLKKAQGQSNLCLADFVAPKNSGKTDYFGFFAVTAGLGLEGLLEEFQKDHDDYNSILAKALCDRLAEAFAEKLHHLVRTEYWGYAASEQLSSVDLIAEKYQGIRPAPGYPACPEHSEKQELFRLLDAENNIAVNLTESFAMWPTASVSGYYIAHPQAHYFGLGKIGRDQVTDYAIRKKVSVEQAERWLSPNLNYD